MPRGKGKVVQKTIKDRNISDMFNQMIGTGNVDMNIVYPKYFNISTITTRLIKLFKVFDFLINFSETSSVSSKFWRVNIYI